MEEGLNLNLVMNGATLLSVLGLAVKVYLSGRAQKIEQPLEVRAAAASTPMKQCDERHDLIENQVENLFGRMIKVENIVVGLDAWREATRQQNHEISTKLDQLLKRK